MTYTLDDLPPTPTPKDYSRLQFDPSQLPKERIVGILACQRDPLLRKLKSRIISAERATISAPPAQKGKSTKRRAATDVHGLGNTAAGGGKEGTVLWEVITEDTVIFPEGGGQPTDTGHLSLLDPNGGIERTWVVEGCLRRKLTAVHLVRLHEGEAIESGREVELSIDWDRRSDHMVIHTAQHLLSAVLDTYNLPTLSWSMTQHPSLDCPYIELPRGLTWKEVQEVEDKCNELIDADVGVWVETSMQREGGVDEEGDRESRGIPKDYEGGVIRHINIDGIDRNACCGTQVPSLSHCGSIHILPPTISPTSSEPSKTPTRISFTAGPRALRYLRQSSRQLSLAAQAIGCGRSDLAERVGRNEELRKDGADMQKGLRGELSKLVIQHVVSGYATRATTSTDTSASTDKKSKVVWVRRDEKTTHDFEFLGSLAGGIISSLPASASPPATAPASASPSDSSRANESEVNPIVVVTSSLPGKDQTHLILVQSNDQEGAKRTNEQIKSALDALAGEGGKRVKGGGAKGRYMSKVEGKWGKAEDAKIAEVIRSLNL